MSVLKAGDIVCLIDSISFISPGSVSPSGVPESASYASFYIKNKEISTLLDILDAPSFFMCHNDDYRDNRVAIVMTNSGVMCWLMFKHLKQLGKYSGTHAD